jgi:sugar (pentulose or hexulose) kinase
MGAEAKVIAVDLGASGGKCFAGLFGENGMELREIHRFSHEPVAVFAADREGRLEERSHWDDLFILRNIVDGLRAYRRDIGAHADSIGVDTWGSDGVLVDPDGVLLGPMYCYRDHRLDGMVDRVKSRMDPARIYEITGIHFQPFNISNQLLWTVENRPGLLRTGVRFLPAPTLFSWYLGGVTSVDSSWASVTQLMDARTRRWSREILRALGIPAKILPRIVAPGTVVGEMHGALAASVGLDPAKIVAVGSHDTASAFAAAPVARAASALIISSGTWSLIGKLVRSPLTGPEAMAGNLSNEGGIGNVRFLKNCMGTWLVQELRRVWRARDGREMDWEELNRITAQGRAFTAFFDPDDPGFYNPPDMEAACAAYCRRTHQEPPADRGTLLRSVYESLALKYRSVADLVARVTGEQHAVVHVVGGGSRNTFLNQLTANACGMKVVAGPEEATAVGNAVVQAMALGVIRKLPDAKAMIRSAFPIREFTPQAREEWEQQYGRFRRVTG